MSTIPEHIATIRAVLAKEGRSRTFDLHASLLVAAHLDEIENAESRATLSDEARVRAERERDLARAQLRFMASTGATPISDGAEERARAYLVEITGISAGEDPTGFLIASHAAIAAAITDWKARAQASEALVRELVEGLRPFAEGGRQVPSSASDTATCAYYRDAIFKAADFRKAQALILRAENLGSSSAERAALLAPQANCSAGQSFSGWERLRARIEEIAAVSDGTLSLTLEGGIPKQLAADLRALLSLIPVPPVEMA